MDIMNTSILYWFTFTFALFKIKSYLLRRSTEHEAVVDGASVDTAPVVLSVELHTPI